MRTEQTTLGGIVNHTATDYQRIELDQDATQHEILARLSRLLPARSYMEVGVRDGCTLWVAIEANPKGITRLALSDTWGDEHGGNGRGSHEHIARLLSAVGWSGSVSWLDGRSQETVPEFLADPFDLVHIDGDHSYEGALADLRNCWPLTDRVMVVHDYHLVPEVREAVENFVAESGAFCTNHDGGNGTAVLWKVP